MSGKRAKRLRTAAKLVQGPARSHHAKKVLLLGVPIVLTVAIGTGYFAFFHNKPDKPYQQHVYPPLTYTQKVKSLDDLLKMTPEQMADVDVAEMNLLCATGLPGGENLDIGRCLETLNQWAAKVKSETERHLYRAHDPKWADHYKHSENWLRAEFLAQVLQEDCGVHYNMERVRNIDFTKSKDLFIHGMIDDPNGGTCSSMPILYVAIGRRLGYPLKLVQTKAHVFVRWDDGKERFNVETTSDGGTDSFPDDYYRTWPEKWTDAEIKNNRYLISLSPAEELASFLGDRGHCLLDNGHAKEAFTAYAAAAKLAPQDPAYVSWMRQANARLRPPGYAAGPNGHREPPMVYRRDDTDLHRYVMPSPQPAGMQRPAPMYGPRPYQPDVPKPYHPNQPPAPGQPPR